MAQGTVKAYSDYVLNSRKGLYSLTDDIRLAYVSNAFASLDTNTTNPTLADVTVTSGGNVSSFYSVSNKTIERAGADVTFNGDDIGQILKDSLNPADIRSAVLYNSTVSNQLVQVWDMTADGTTPPDLVNNDFTFNFGAAGINTSTNTSA